MPLSDKQIAILAARDKKVAAVLTGRKDGASFRLLAIKTKLEPNHLRSSCRRLIAKGTVKMFGRSRAALYFGKGFEPEKVVKAKPVAKRPAAKTVRVGGLRLKAKRAKKKKK